MDNANTTLLKLKTDIIKESKKGSSFLISIVFVIAVVGLKLEMKEAT